MNLPIDLKHYRAPRWYDSVKPFVEKNWWVLVFAVYFSLVYFAY